MAAPKSNTSKLITNAIKYGPIIAEGVRRYGPTVKEQFASGTGPLGEMSSKTLRRGESRRNALAHAASVVDGSAMQCFHQAKEYWVVFSGESPIGVHPFTSLPYSELLRHADLSKRLRPTDARARGIRGKVASLLSSPTPSPAPRPYGASGTGNATGTQNARPSEPIEGEII